MSITPHATKIMATFGVLVLTGVLLTSLPTAAPTFAALSASLSQANVIPQNGRFDVGTPPLRVAMPGRVEVFSFLQSATFASTYWERFPVLIQTNQAFASVLSLERDVLRSSFVVRGNKRVAPFRNVRFVPSQVWRA